VKIAVFAPMPTAIEATAVRANSGWRRIMRTATRRFRMHGDTRDARGG
jgi:hypothetical protein